MVFFSSSRPFLSRALSLCPCVCFGCKSNHFYILSVVLLHIKYDSKLLSAIHLVSYTVLAMGQPWIFLVKNKQNCLSPANAHEKVYVCECVYGIRFVWLTSSCSLRLPLLLLMLVVTSSFSVSVFFSEACAVRMIRDKLQYKTHSHTHIQETEP